MNPAAWTPSKSLATRAAKRKSGVRANINLWPFIGLLLALLVTFMVIPSAYHGIRANYPIGPHAVLQPGARREDAIRISVFRDGQIYFRNTRAIANDLADLITGAVKDGAEKKVYIAADARVRNRDVEVVLDQVRTAGITRVAILTN
jgi:biopolymer transport protein TolR